MVIKVVTLTLQCGSRLSANYLISLRPVAVRPAGLLYCKNGSENWRFEGRAVVKRILCLFEYCITKYIVVISQAFDSLIWNRLGLYFFISLKETFL